MNRVEFRNDTEMHENCKTYNEAYGSICMKAILKRKRKADDFAMKAKIEKLRFEMIRSGICPDCGRDLVVTNKKWWQVLCFGKPDMHYFCPEHGEVLRYWFPSLGPGPP